MKLLRILFIICFTFFSVIKSNSQEATLPIFYDYLSDNVYLLHPAAAGVGNCGKIRLTAGSYWKDNELQTVSFHTKLDNYTRTALGGIVFNDKNGYHSQKGMYATYAYHIEMNRGGVFNQLSFGLSIGGVQNQVDQSTFEGDPTVAQLVRSDFYFSSDFGIGYHYGGLSSYFTVKNLFLSAKPEASLRSESLNLRNFILGVGYFFGDEEKLEYEPSFMVQFKPSTGEKIADFNMKVYKMLPKAQLWAGVSYRRSFDSDRFAFGRIQNISQLTPIIGANMGKFMISYSYTSQMGDLVYEGAFHQISLGLNILCRKPRASACPNINASFY